MCEDLNIGYFSIDLNKHSNCEFTLNINSRENSTSEICLAYMFILFYFCTKLHMEAKIFVKFISLS